MKDLRISHRPKQMSELWGNEFLKKVWQGMVQSRGFPKSIILNGPFGAGKTSLARIMGEDLIRNGETDTLLSPQEQFKEINSPTCDFITVCKLLNQFENYVHGTIVLFFDEAQRIQDKAQNGLLKSIEDADNLHFLFATTKLDSIDDGIKSRSTIFNLKYPSSEILIKKLKLTADKEGIQITDGALSKLIIKSHCSPRECLGNLFLFANHKGVIDVADIEEALYAVS